MAQIGLFDAPQGSGETWQSLRDRGALFVVNHSGGKDSQALFLKVRALIPKAQIIVVHSILHEVDWPGIDTHIENTVDVPVYYVAAAKGLLEMVEQRGKFPSPAIRQCTSDLKRGPTETFLRRFLKLHPEFHDRVVNVMGLRAEESSQRAKLIPWQRSQRNSKAGREWYEWLPIHGLTESEVFKAIRDAGQKPHWAYAKGMTRLSCCFCIMASDQDLRTAAQLRPALYRRYAALEKQINFTMAMSRRPLPDITGIPA